MRKNTLVCTLVCLLIAAAASAQTLNIGPNPSSDNASAGGGFDTFVDFAVPATANGTVTSVTFRWAAFVCPNAAKIKFFHRTGTTLTLIAERGPFTTTAVSNTVTLTPPVAVQTGDLIGITQLTSCGNATALVGAGPSPGYLRVVGDPTGSFDISSGQSVADRLLAVGGSGPAVSGPTIPALSPLAATLLAIGLALIGSLAMRR
jgi:hypothetical protein